MVQDDGNGKSGYEPREVKDWGLKLGDFGGAAHYSDRPLMADLGQLANQHVAGLHPFLGGYFQP